MKLNKPEPEVALAIILLALPLILIIGIPSLRLLSVNPPGWEMYNQIGAVRHNDVIMDSEDNFTNPRELMGVYWKVDWDDKTYGVPTIQVQTGDLHHVDFMGKTIPNTQPTDSITFERGNYSYFLDYHVYMFTVTIRTVADKTIVGVSPVWGLATIYHETSWPYTYKAPADSGTGQIGEAFKGGVYVKFVINPWQGFTYRDPPEAEGEDYYVLESCWAGVMNAYLANKEMGQTANQWDNRPNPEDGDMFFKAGLDRGNQVPMLLDDGCFGDPAPTVDWDPAVTPDEDIQSTVVLYLPVELLAGADAEFNGWGCSTNLYPCDVYVMYTVRIDVLTTHGFILHTAKEPPDPDPPSDYFSWAEDFWDGVFAAIGMMNPFRIFGPLAPFVAFVAILLLLGLVTLIVLAVFAPGVLALMSKRRPAPVDG